MKLPLDTPILIVQLGCGGTGGYIVRDLCRLLYVLERPIRLVLADADRVEEKNLTRQNFTPADLGANKAEVLAARYSGAFGVPVSYLPEYVETMERLRQVTMSKYASYTDKDGELRQGLEELILVGAVDNFKTRRLCDQFFQEEKDMIYIDAGNGEYTGQVVCGVKRNGKEVLPPLSKVHPDILEQEDRFPSELSCADAAVSSPQAIVANLHAALIVLNILYKLLAEGELDVPEVNFSSKSIAMQPNLQYRKQAAVERRKERNGKHESKKTVRPQGTDA